MMSRKDGKLQQLEDKIKWDCDIARLDPSHNNKKKGNRMSYILDVMNEKIEPRADRITLERYIIESSYITKYLSPIVKDNALAIYHVLFHLSYFQTGKAEVVIPWAKVGAFICSDQGNIIDDNSTVKRRLPPLIQNQCITVNRQRSGANKIVVHLPSEIPACKELIEKEESTLLRTEKPDDADYYTDQERRLMVLERDNRKCTYCLVDVAEDSYVLDHIVPISKGGTNKKFNLVTSCQECNQRKRDEDAIKFLLSNYRAQLINQDEYLKQKDYIENLISKQN